MTGILSILASIPLVATAVTGVTAPDAAPEVFESVEVGVAEVSPVGPDGGYMIPASGSSFPDFSCALSINPSNIDTDYGPDKISISNTVNPGLTGAVYTLKLYRHANNGLPSYLGQQVTNASDSERNRSWSVNTPRDPGTYRYELEVIRTKSYSSANNCDNDTSNRAAAILAEGIDRDTNNNTSSCGTHSHTETLSRTCSVNLVVERAPEPVPKEPDLRPTKAPTQPQNIREGDRITFTGGRIKNGGDTKANDFQNRYVIAINGNTNNTETRATGRVSLAKDNFVDVTANGTWTAVIGTHRIRLVADSERDVEESDENNNTSEWVEFTVRPALPDLYPTRLPTKPSGVVAGDSYFFTGGRIKNGGGSDANGFNNAYEIAINGDTRNIQESRATGRIDTLGEDVFSDVTAVNRWPAVAGTHKVRLVADVGQNVPESDETNNATEWVTFTVKGDDDDFPQCSDLIDNEDPEDTLADADDPGCWTDPDDPTTYDPDDPDERDPDDPVENGIDLKPTKRPNVPVDAEAGDRITFTGGRVKNGGTDNAGEFQNRYEIAINGNENNLWRPATGRIPLAAGDFEDVTALNKWTAVAGAHKVRLVVDTEDDITETDESNNATEWRSFTVKGDDDDDDFPQCSDLIDNEDPEDTLADADDPGCWTDPDDPTTYDPDDPNERDPDTPTKDVNLVAGRPSVSGTLAVGEVLTLTGGTVTNDGKEDVTTKFNNRYEIDLDRDGIVEVRRTTGAINSLPSGGKVFADDRSWTAEEGKHRIRFVADFKDTVGETDEKDNVSEWRNFVIPGSDCDDCGPGDGDDGPTVDLKINGKEGPVTISPNESVTLSWTVTGEKADSCTSNFMSNPSPTGGSRVVTGPGAGERVYTITCENDDGDDTDSEKVVVSGGPGGDPTIDADPRRVQRNGVSELEWNTNGNASCSVSGTNGDTFSVTGPGTRNTPGLLAETTYTIDCGGSRMDSVTITILPFIEEI